MRYTREEAAESLKIMERSLLVDINTANDTYKVLKTVFENTWLALLKGTTNYQVYTEKESLIKNILVFTKSSQREVWRGNDKNAATILNELHQYNNSETLEGLSIQDISTAIVQVRKETAVEDGFNIIDIDEAEIAQITRVYNQYLKSDPKLFINQLSPLNMVSLYLYAVTIGDESLQENIILSNGEIESDF